MHEDGIHCNVSGSSWNCYNGLCTSQLTLCLPVLSAVEADWRSG